MDHPISRAEPIRTRPLPEQEQGLLPNPVVRTPTDGLLIDLGFDPPSVTVTLFLASVYISNVTLNTFLSIFLVNTSLPRTSATLARIVTRPRSMDVEFWHYMFVV